MTSDFRFLARLLAVTAITILAGFFGSRSQSNDLPAIEVWVIDTALSSGQTDARIPVYVRNYSEDIMGFTLLLQMDRPDLAEFEPEIDTVGSLISNWEFIDSRNFGGQPTSLRVVAMADLPGPPTTPGIAPQMGQMPLFYLRTVVADVPDTLGDRTVEIHINDETFENFGFANFDGQIIGSIRDSVFDTAYYNCIEYSEDSCIAWERVDGPPEPYDSLLPYWRYVSYLDTTQVFVEDGSITVTGGYACGDLNGDSLIADISDLILLVDYMFTGGPPPAALMAADCSGDASVDVSDLVCFVDYMFGGGDPPVCGY